MKTEAIKSNNFSQFLYDALHTLFYTHIFPDIFCLIEIFSLCVRAFIRVLECDAGFDDDELIEDRDTPAAAAAASADSRWRS